MDKKPETPQRKARRNYEERHKNERKEKNMPFGTSLNREYAEEINKFLKRHRLTKVELIVAGYQTLQNQYGPNKTE